MTHGVGFGNEMGDLESRYPHPRVFSVRVASKGLMLDAASTFVDTGFKVKQLKVESSKLKEEGSEGVTRRVFCKRVPKPLIAKGLRKYAFLKSAEEYENVGVNFVLFAEKSEKSEGASGWWSNGGWVVWGSVDLNTEVAEFTESRAR